MTTSGPASAPTPASAPGFDDMKRVVVTPAGRKRYLEILVQHLAAQRDAFDVWILLVNTSVVEDIGFCERLAARHPDWIETRYATGSNPGEGSHNIHRFLNEFCIDPETVYLRLDDDVVYLAPGFVREMFDFRLANPHPFLVYSNIINNAIVAWIHQKLGNFSYERLSGYDCVDEIGWKDPRFAETLHRAFLADPVDPKWKFREWHATEYERVSINAISWFGKDLAVEPVDRDEENWFATWRPKVLERPNVICGTAICVHFAFFTQREYLESQAPDILEAYAKLAAALTW